MGKVIDFQSRARLDGHVRMILSGSRAALENPVFFDKLEAALKKIHKEFGVAALLESTVDMKALLEVGDEPA